MSREHTVSWAKKPTNSTNRSSRTAPLKKTVERRTPKKLCQKCSLLGVQSALQLFQLNDDEALLMCKNVDCTFMSSPSWENLVVKRDISRVSSGASNKKFPALRKAQSVCSFPPPVRSDIHTAHSTGLSASISRQNFSHSSSLESIRPSTPVGNLSSFEEEKKTLVPFAPFLCGHAHSFSSFQTKRKDKEQLCKNFEPPLYTAVSPITGVTFRKGSFTSVSSRSQTGSVLGKNRRSSSVESESLSSGSLDSRPATPTFTAQLPGITTGDKVRKLVVPPETLAKIIDGSLKVKLIRSSKSRGSQVTNCYPIAQTSTVSDAKTTVPSNQIYPSQPSTYTSSPDKPSVICESGQSDPSHIQAINSFIDSEGIDSLHFAPVSYFSTENPGTRNLVITQLPATRDSTFDTNPVNSYCDLTNYQIVSSTDSHFTNVSDSSDSLLSSFTQGLAKDTEECTDFVLDASLFDV